MNCNGMWSRAHYQPLDRTDRILVDRVAPSEVSVLLTWSGHSKAYDVWFRKKGTEDAWNRMSVGEACNAELNGLDENTDYEFFVEGTDEKSLIGYFRTGYVPGTVVNYLHPDDLKYAFSGRHLCTPSLLIHPDGYLLASMDVYEGGRPQNLTMIFRSDDRGETWYHYTDLFPCFWGTLFLHKGDVYMLGTSTEYGDLLIGKSTDCGKTWLSPTVLARGACHREIPGWHKSGMPVIEHAGRLWCGVDYGSHRSGGHMSALVSVGVDSDLLNAENWTITDPLKYSSEWEGAVEGDSRGFIEGNAVVMPDGSLCNILRYLTELGTPDHGLIGVLKADATQPEKALFFHKFVPFEGNLSKFDVKRDEKTGVYFSIFSRIIPNGWIKMRNVLSLGYSYDLEHWTTACDLINYEECDPKKVGFQYVSFSFDGEDIIYLSRTAFNEAQGFHDNNYITFHRLKNFRDLIKKEEEMKQ